MHDKNMEEVVSQAGILTLIFFINVTILPWYVSERHIRYVDFQKISLGLHVTKEGD